MSLNYTKNRCTKWQCVSIPSECPHDITNDTDEEVIIAWCYLSLTDKVMMTVKIVTHNTNLCIQVNPSKNYNWKWLENIF